MIWLGEFCEVKDRFLYDLLFGSLIAFFAPLVGFLILNFGIIPWEVGLMEKQYGMRYLDYKERVGRWF